MSVIYLAAPMVTYGTALYERNRARVAELFPGAELICPADGLYPSPRVFRATYREHLRDCTGVVCFTSEAGFLGWGACEEIRCARLLGKPVWLLTGAGELEPEPVIVTVNPADKQAYAMPVVAAGAV